MFLRYFFQLTVCLIATFVSATVAHGDNPIGEVDSPPWMQSIAENPAGTYRETVDGWMDTSQWRVGGDEGKVKFIDNIHPVVWMLLVVFLSSGLAVLASDDESVSELWRSDAS